MRIHLTIAATAVASLLLTGCKTTDEMSYGELQQFFNVVAEKCDKQFGAKTSEEHKACVRHEMRRHNVSVNRGRDAGDALIAASSANRGVTCSTIGNITNCY